MSLPPLPERYEGDGFDFMQRLTGGWYAVALWGNQGWNLGRWPHQLICHYDGEPFGFCSFTEGDLEVCEFATREERNRKTDEYFVWFNRFHEIKSAPVTMKNPHKLGPYTGQ